MAKASLAVIFLCGSTLNKLTIRAKACGVSINMIAHWRRKGLIRAHAINDRMQFLFEDPGPNPPKKHCRNAVSKAA
jgi:hypothetical protein